MRSPDHALHYSASRGKNSAYVVTHHSVLFIYLTLPFSLALASTSRNWPRPHSPGLGLGLGLGLEALVSASASKLWPRPRPRPRSSGLGLGLKILASFNITAEDRLQSTVDNTRLAVLKFSNCRVWDTLISFEHGVR